MKAFGLTNRKIYKHLGGGLYCGKKNNFPKTTEKGKKSTKVSFIPFLVFGHFWRRSYKNMKILHNLCLHFTWQDGQEGKKPKEDHATKVTKIPSFLFLCKSQIPRVKVSTFLSGTFSVFAFAFYVCGEILGFLSVQLLGQ